MQVHIFVFMLVYLGVSFSEDSRTERIPTAAELNKLLDPSIGQQESGQERPKCYTTSADVTNKPLIGRWINGSNPFPGTFGRQYKLEEWWLNACPAESATYSCTFSDPHEYQGHGYEAAHRHFQVDNCELTPFVPSDFFNLMRDRNIHFCCDSTAMQTWTMFVCSLHGFTRADYSGVLWDDLSHIFAHTRCVDKTGIHCHIKTAEVYYPDFNIRLTYYGSLNDPFANRKDLYSVKDVVILNHGDHFGAQGIRHMAESVGRQYSQIPASKRFVLLWRESWAQHFNTSQTPNIPTGYYTWRKGEPCVSLMDQVEKARATDYRNNIANEIMMKYQIPILRIHNVSLDTHDQHVGKQSRTDEEGVYDCTHYCNNAGMLYFIRDLIANALPPLLPKLNVRFRIDDRSP